MCVPALIVLIMFSYIPFAGIWMAFTDFNVVDGIFGSKFVGLDNFKYFFRKTAWDGRLLITRCISTFSVSS